MEHPFSRDSHRDRATIRKFSKLSIGLHWLTVLVLIAVYVAMEFRGLFPKGSDAREAMKNWHYLLGLSVFALVWMRIVARSIHGAPAIRPPPRQWQAYSALAIHIALYAFMISMPAIGFVLLSSEGKTVSLFGLHFPVLMSKNPAIADRFEEAHEMIATVGYFLIGLHTAAALLHHYVLRDNTLRRMSPFGGR